MDIQDVRQKINITIKKVSEQDNPNVKLIQDCIDLIKENGLEKELFEELSNLKMLYTMGSFLEAGNDFADLDEKKSKKTLIFTIRETEDGKLATNLEMEGLQTLELLGAIALMERAVHKVLKENNDIP